MSNTAQARKKVKENRKGGIPKPPPDNALLGTALITNFVKDSQVREGDQAILNAMKDSVWSALRSTQAADQKAYWVSAAMLAAYNLGKEGIKLAPPVNNIKP